MEQYFLRINRLVQAWQLLAPQDLRRPSVSGGLGQHSWQLACRIEQGHV